MEREQSPQAMAVRGVMLLIVLAGAGALVVTKGFHDDKPTTKVAITTPGATTASTVKGGTGGGTTVAPTTTVANSTLPSIPRTNIKIVVANASGVSGAAGKMGDKLAALGYTVSKRTNANGAVVKQVQASTTVYFIEGAQTQASLVAQSLAVGTAVPKTLLMPEPAPILKADLGEAQVVVLLGLDLAR